MKRMLERIREILRNRHNRRAWTRIISVIACLVVFFSTYALIVPAITMEKTAYCGIETHQHDDSCYSEELICTIPESEGHTHDDSCYTTHDELSCQLEEHVHGEGCYDEEGNLICELIEHEHDSSCWQEVTELTCGLEESEGHHHTDACYEKVLTCGKETHTHSEACYELNGPEAAGTAATDARGVVIGGDNSGKPADDKTAEVDVSTVGETDPNAATDSAAVGLTTGAAADPDTYVPTLDELDFNRILNRNTGIYYYHVETAEDAAENQGDAENIGEEDKNQGNDQAGEQAKSHPEEINSADIPADAWQKVNKKTVLGENDILRVYFSYTIPAGSLNETNDIARYRLPANLHINDDQIKAINKTENGIAAAFIDYDTLAITDADAYHKYLGVEAVEGTRRPGEIPAEDVQEYISAVVRVENIYDTEGLYGKKDALLGQDLVFTFVPYTVQTNQNTYDAQGDPTSAGETVKGWFTMDLTIDQIDFQPTSSADSSSDSLDLTSGTREAEIVFVEKYKDPAQGIEIDEISTKLVLKDASQEDLQMQDDSAEDADDPENAENSEQAENADNSEPVGEADVSDESDKEASAEDGAETETDLDETNYPAQSFQDSITVHMGSLSTDTNAVNTSEDSGNTTAAAAAPDIQDRTELTVSVEAEEGTFPEGTTMHLASVTGSDLDTVAEAVEGAVESRTAGFHAVDITFHDADGNEIEPRKPIKVSMQSESIRQAVENPSTAPVVVHVEDNKKEHEEENKKDNITGNINDNKDESEADRKDEMTAEAESSSSIGLDSATVTGTTVPGAAEADNLTFEADSFSVYAVVYTVDFAYEEYTYSIRGGNSILLSDMVKELHISDNDAAFMSRVKNVEFTDPALMRVTYINNPTTVAAVEEYIFDGVFDDAEKEPGSNRKLDEGEWLLTSLAPFKTEEALTITLDSGRQIVITVLDGEEVAGNTFITDAHLTIDGTTYGKDEPWTVYPDVGYTMKLSFAEKGQNQFPAGGDTIVVDLPQGLTIEGNVHHTFAIPAGLAGSITGNEYWVENGKLYVKFGEDPEDILTRSSNAHFALTFTARFDEGTTIIPFNDKVEPNIDMDITADVSVSKSASYNSTTGKMDYTITVKSTGNSEDVKVHDALTNTNLLKIDTDSIRISPAGTEYNITDSSQGGFDMTIPSIGHNQTVTITYSADVDTSALDHKGNIKVSDDGKNTVTVENDDDDHDDDTNTYTNRIKYSSTSKTSTSVVDHETEQDPDNKTATLGWKIVLNDNYRGSIVGDKVWDSIDWSSKDAMKYTVDENGNITLHIAAKSQDGMKTYNTTVTAAVVTDPNGVQSWEYTIPQLGEDPDEILSYEITYTTEVNKTELDSSSNGIVKNNTTNEGDGSSTATGVVPIPHSDEPGEDEIVGGKAAVDVTEEYVDWDIVINVPAEGFPDGLTVTDYVPMAPQYGGFADTYDSILSVTGLANGETYTVDCVSTDVDENGNVIWDLRNYNRKRDVVTIEFYQDAQKTRSGLSRTGQARTLTIRIRTKNDPAWLAYIEREGSGDSNAYYHTNIAKANNTTFEGKAAPQKSKIYKTLVPGNETASDGMPVYRYAVDLAGVKSLPIVIEDTFNADELKYYDYWYETDTHQYIDGKPQRHMLNNGISPYKADIVAENGKITITAEDLPRKENGDFWEYYRIYYKLKVKNQTALDSFTQKAIENGGVYNVRNTAAWNGTDDHVDIEFKVPTVEKTGAFRVNQGESGNDRLYDFAIDINEKCLELNGGESMDLTDTHTDNLTVDYTTIKVYKYVNGEKVQDTSIQWNFDGNIGTFYNLQDRTHYVIEYSCLVIGSATQSFSNYAEMNGFHGEKHDSRDFGTTVEAGADVFQIGLIKFKNGMTSQGLGGATFQLFRGTGSFHEVTNGTDTWMEEDRIPMTWGVGTETAGKVGQNITFTTNEDGYVLIALDQTKHGAELEEGVHYFLKEIESPPGYQIDSSVEYWEFTLTKDPDEVCYGTKRDQYGNRLWIYFYYDDILKMNNTETDQPITVDVDKEWFDFQGNKIENPEGVTAKVQLYQKKNNEDYAAVE
ncbi:MAG: hypothetical protein IJG15_03000, partial [Lachnospiraceae bacterium]|nr:hypothetical protein [Lachnospiraceae bacterium]